MATIKKFQVSVDIGKNVKGFTKSKYASSIYYADIFRINEKNWMILGHGKSEAGMLASNNDRGSDLSRDCVALAVKAGKLYGRYDPGALGMHHDEDSELHKFHNIDYIAYCLSPEQTAKIYHFKEMEITSCDRNLMSRLSVIYPYPAYTAHLSFNPEELQNLSDPQRRRKTFYNLMNEAGFNNILLVPFMDSIGSKADLYKKYGKVSA